MNKKAVLLILDGLGDLPTPKTPLQMAKKPNMDKLSKQGMNGLIHVIAPGVKPGSDTGHLTLFGYEPWEYYKGRGPLEALGADIPLDEGDVAFRANFATVEGGIIKDRRAGRIDSETAEKLSKKLSTRIRGVDLIFKSTFEHRGVLVLKGKNLGHRISDTDPHTEGPVQKCRPLFESDFEHRTAEIINDYTKYAMKILRENSVNQERKRKGLLPANALLVRGAGKYMQIPSMKERFDITSACVAGGNLYKGCAKYVGMDIISVPGATGTKNTNLKAKADAAVKALKGHDFVFVHVKATDSFGHDGKCKEKAKMIEKVDKDLIPGLAKTGAYLMITGDHSTPCIRKGHSGHPVPVLLHGENLRTDDVKKFDEINCAKGGLGQFYGKDVMNILLDSMGKSKYYGS
ncbi:2,3-bisphosphoglycerate-independent phosphoglycerate mutase [Candidatus Micrarchaeota archaeon]|nr:2,3-bisphosphoglycerate-independent phosphoglycerate mutase [Candidatus Micrarchaeota archaeon]